MLVPFGAAAVTVQSFQEKEQALYADLSTLVKDAAWLRHYMSSALRVQGDALVGAATALGDTTRPDVTLSMSSLSLGSQGTNSQGGTVAPPSGMLPIDSRGPTPVHTAPSSATGSRDDGPSNPFLASGVIQQ